MPAKDITAAMLVIGDEILSGRTRDKNIGVLADFCGELGIDLKEVRIIGDELDEIVSALNALREKYRYVFTSGGIGPTHDDITADAVAVAFGSKLEISEAAKQAMLDRFPGYEMTPARLRMARIPQGGDLIENSVSAAPGIHIGNVYVMAGVPSVFEAMLAAIAPTLETGKRVLSTSIDCFVGEGRLGDPLGELQAEFPDVKIGSYPQFGGGRRFLTQVVLRSADQSRLNAATDAVQALVERLHTEHQAEIANHPKT